jgi:hypothetical protein
MVVVLYGTVLYQQGKISNTPVFPWQWGKE